MLYHLLHLVLLTFLVPYSHAGGPAKLHYTNENGPIFKKITHIFQAYIEFLEGPFATMAIFASLTIGICAWVYAPKNGAMGFLVRVCIGGILLLNVSTILHMFQNVSS